MMNNNSVKASPYKEVKNSGNNFQNKRESISKRQTEKYLLYTLIASLVLLLVMLGYIINEYLEVSNATAEYLDSQYQFGADQPFYLESSEAYLKFVVRFITIYGIISFFGIASIVLRKPWLYLLVIVTTIISVIYFFLL